MENSYETNIFWFMDHITIEPVLAEVQEWIWNSKLES
jgi:hypothetical protein